MLSVIIISVCLFVFVGAIGIAMLASAINNLPPME